METQKFVNFLNNSDNESSKFATIKQCVINYQNNTEYGTGNENHSNIKFETKVIQSNLCDYSEACIIETGDMTAIGGNADTKVTFKTPAPFTRCVTHINDEDIDTSENTDIIIPMYTMA